MNPNAKPAAAAVVEERTDFAVRIKQIFDANETLRETSGTLRHQLQERDRQLEELSRQLDEAQKDQSVSEVMMQRQLLEWQHRAQALEQQNQVLLLQHECQKHHSKPDPKLVQAQQRWEELELENNHLLDQQRTQQDSWGHQRNLYQREIASLQENIKGLEHRLEYFEESRREVLPDKRSRSIELSSSTGEPSQEEERNETRAVVASLQKLLQQKEQAEIALQEELLDSHHEARMAREEAECAQERVELLETYLEVSLNSMPSQEKDLAATIIQSVHNLEEQQHERHQERNVQQSLHQATDGQSSEEDSSSRLLALPNEPSIQRGLIFDTSTAPAKRLTEILDHHHAAEEVTNKNQQGGNEALRNSISQALISAHRNKVDAQIIGLREQCETLTKQCETLTEEKGEWSSQSQAQLEQITKLQNEIQKAKIQEDEMVASFQGQLDALNNANEIESVRLAEIQEQNHTLDVQCRTLTQARDDLMALSHTQLDEITKLQNEKIQVEETSASLQQQLDDHNRTKEIESVRSVELQERIQSLEGQCRILEEERVKSTVLSKRQLEEIRKLQNEMQKLKKQEEETSSSFKEQLNDHSNAREIESVRSAEFQDRNQILTEEISKLEKEIQYAQKQEEETVTSFRQQLDGLRVEKDSEASRYAMLQEQLEVLQHQFGTLKQENVDLTALSKTQAEEITYLRKAMQASKTHEEEMAASVEQKIDDLNKAKEIELQRSAELEKECINFKQKSRMLAEEKAALEIVCQERLDAVVRIQDDLDEVMRVQDGDQRSRDVAASFDAQIEEHTKTTLKMQECYNALETRSNNLAEEKTALEVLSQDRLEEVRSLQGDLQRFQTENKIQLVRIKELQDRGETLELESRKISDEMELKVNEFSKAKERDSVTITQLEQEREDLTNRIVVLKDEALEATDRSKTLIVEYEQLRTESQTLAILQETLEETMEKQASELVAQKERVVTLKQELLELMSRNEMLRTESDEHLGHLEDKSMELADSIDVQKDLRQRLKHAHETIASLESEKEQALAEYAELMNQVDTTKKEHADEKASLLKQIDEADGVHRDLMERLASTEKDILEYRNRIKLYEHEAAVVDKAASIGPSGEHTRLSEDDERHSIPKSAFVVRDTEARSTNTTQDTQETSFLFEEKGFDCDSDLGVLREELLRCKGINAGLANELASVENTLAEERMLHADEELLRLNFMARLESLNRTLQEEIETADILLLEDRGLHDDIEQLRQDFICHLVEGLETSHVALNSATKQAADTMPVEEDFDMARKALEEECMLHEDTEALHEDFLRTYVVSVDTRNSSLNEELKRVSIALKSLEDDNVNLKEAVNISMEKLVASRERERLAEEKYEEAEGRILALIANEKNNDALSSKEANAANEKIIVKATELGMKARSLNESIETDEESSLPMADSELLEARAKIARLTTERDTALAEADERQWKAEDSLASLRADLDDALTHSKQLSNELEKSKNDVEESKRSMNALLADIDAVQEQASRAQSLEQELKIVAIDLATAKSLLVASVKEAESKAAANEVLKEKINVANEQCENLSSEISSIRQSCADKDIELQSTVAQCAEQQEQIDIAVSQVQELEARVKELQSEKQTMQQDSDRRVDAACVQLTEMENQVKLLETEIASLSGAKDYAVAEQLQAKEKLDGLLSELDEMEGLLLACQEELETSKLHVKTLEGKLRALGAENRSYQHENTARSNTENLLKNDSESLKEELATRRKEMTTIEEKLLHSECTIRDLTAREEEQVTKNKDLSTRMEILETTILFLETAKDGLEEQLVATEGKIQKAVTECEKQKSLNETLREELEKATEALEEERMLNDDEEQLRQILLTRLNEMESQANHRHPGSSIGNATTATRTPTMMKPIPTTPPPFFSSTPGISSSRLP